MPARTKRSRRTRLARAALLRDAKNRAVRTLLQGPFLVAVVVVADAAYAWLLGGSFDVRLVAGSAIAAVTAPGVAYLHRLKVDPLGVPSAVPPSDPGPPADPAPLL